MRPAEAYKAFFDELHKVHDVEKRQEQIRRRFASEEEKRGYYNNWVREQRRKQAERLVDPISRPALIDMFNRKDFRDDLDRGNLVNVMHWPYVPWLFVGRDEHGDLYRIVPRPLRPSARSACQ